MAQNLLSGNQGRVYVPSISEAAGNALSMRRMQLDNALAEKQVGNYEANRGKDEELQRIQIEANAIKTALSAGNTKQATEIYRQLGGKSKNNIEIITDEKNKPNVSIDYGDNTFSGPGVAVAELMENISKNPSWANDPKTKAWSAARGISSQPSKTALLKNKGTASAKPEVTKSKALNRISTLQKARATLEKTDMVTALLAKNNPELSKLIGQKLDPELKAALLDAWDNELDYMERFSGTKRKESKTDSGTNVTHTFIPGKGLVPVQ